MKNSEENSEKIVKIWKTPKQNRETIWNMQKKIVKRIVKYGRKVN